MAIASHPTGDNTADIGGERLRFRSDPAQREIAG
jgi:hypothetical protein